MKKATFFLLMIFMFTIIGCTDRSITTTQATENITVEEDSCSFKISIDITNGVDQIETKYVNCLAYGTGNDVFTADGICPIYNMLDHISDYEIINQTENLELIKDSFSINITRIEVFESEGTLLETWDTWSNRTTLSAGQYIIKIITSNNESTCYVSGYNFFILNVE